jgi:Ribonuclease H2 non-catalytic subunit (Ylr154p-like)
MESNAPPIATCHSVPCNIAYTGPAPGVDVYFRPMDLPTPSTAGDASTVRFQAAAIRGRGLLTKLDDRNVVNGHVLKVKSNSCSSEIDPGEVKEVRGLQSIRSFDRFLEWHHEHQTSVLQNMRSSSKLDRAREWMQTAEALHAPLPIKTSNNGLAETC